MTITEWTTATLQRCSVDSRIAALRLHFPSWICEGCEVRGTVWWGLVEDGSETLAFGKQVAGRPSGERHRGHLVEGEVFGSALLDVVCQRLHWIGRFCGAGVRAVFDVEDARARYVQLVRQSTAAERLVGEFAVELVVARVMVRSHVIPWALLTVIA